MVALLQDSRLRGHDFIGEREGKSAGVDLTPAQSDCFQTLFANRLERIFFAKKTCSLFS
jgi:hypothetical protein